MDLSVPYILLISTLLTKFHALSISPSLRADIFLNTVEMISKYGYPAETHTVTTPDGYILNMHRIPFSPKSPAAPDKPAVFIQHGMLASSADYVIPGPNSALAYLLADAGYDVFLGNSRGNMYSKKHVNLTAGDKQYWNFSWHEMALYDVPTQIDYILKIRNQEQLYYIGMSMGTTIFFGLTSKRPEYSKKIKFMIAMAPIAYFNNSDPSTIGTAKYFLNLMPLAHLLNVGEIVPHTSFGDWRAEHICTSEFLKEKCIRRLFPNRIPEEEKYANMTVIPVSNSHFPAGASLKTLLHFLQMMRTGRFQEFDYGRRKNLLIYGQSNPPEYNITLVSAKMGILYAFADPYNGPKGVSNLCEKVQHCVDIYEVPRKTFQHLEFVLGIAKDIKSLAYDKVIQLLKDN